MGKGLNPADAHRREQKRREKKKNQKQRNLSREVRTYIDDPNKCRAEINRLEAQGRTKRLATHEAARLSHLKDTLKAIERLPPKRKPAAAAAAPPPPATKKADPLAPGAAPLYTQSGFAETAAAAQNRQVVHAIPEAPEAPAPHPTAVAGAPSLPTRGGPRAAPVRAEVSKDLLMFVPKTLRKAVAAPRPAAAAAPAAAPAAAGALGKRPAEDAAGAGPGPAPAPAPGPEKRARTSGYVPMSSVPRPAGARLLGVPRPAGARLLGASRLGLGSSVPRPAGSRLLAGSARALSGAAAGPAVGPAPGPQPAPGPELPQPASQPARLPESTGDGALDDFFSELNALPAAEES